VSTNGRPIPQLTEADQRRFWVKVQLPDERGCTAWTAAKNSNGYGVFGLGGSRFYAHRVSWVLANGPIPPGKVIDHLCRNRVCVNPLHLEVTDSRTNILRGEAPTAENAKRTHCPWGHEYTAENTYVRPPSKAHPNGGRDCRTCKRERDRARRVSRAAVSTPST